MSYTPPFCLFTVLVVKKVLSEYFSSLLWNKPNWFHSFIRYFNIYSSSNKVSINFLISLTLTECSQIHFENPSVWIFAWLIIYFYKYLIDFILIVIASLKYKIGLNVLKSMIIWMTHYINFDLKAYEISISKRQKKPKWAFLLNKMVLYLFNF